MTLAFIPLFFQLYDTGRTRTHPQSQIYFYRKLSTETHSHPVSRSLKAFCNLQLLHQRPNGTFVGKVQLFHYNTGQKECELTASFHTTVTFKTKISFQNNFSPSFCLSCIVQFLLIVTSQLEFMILHNKLTGCGCLVTITSW